jgi:hypothetical protein
MALGMTDVFLRKTERLKDTLFKIADLPLILIDYNYYDKKLYIRLIWTVRIVIGNKKFDCSVLQSNFLFIILFSNDIQLSNVSILKFPHR